MHAGYWCAITVKSLQTLLETFKDSIYNAYTQGGVPMVVTSSTHHTILDTTPSPKVGVACIFTCNNMNYFTSSHDVSHLT